MGCGCPCRAAAMDTVNAVVCNPKYKTLFTIIKAIRNGLMYGLKIRIPHSLVMTFLFHDGSIADKLRFIISSGCEHAKRLAIFGLVYKVIGFILRAVLGSGTHVHLQTLVSAVIGGYCAFGTNTKISMQVNMYLLSRVTIGLSKLAVKKGLIRDPPFNVFPVFAMVVWGLALLLFEYHPDTLQQSLQNSMTYLHHDSYTWNNVMDLLVYNSVTLW